MNIEDLHDHIISMWSSATEQYWDAYECGDVDGMFNAIEPFHDCASCVICEEFYDA